ncbi:MAG: 50S ribosomal protein L10 [Deltaproteobacteria bacterium]|nr:50S ribosomal protein L10 [Deltaproteobacteria bacterium]MBV8454852.1 50S ribosomal protein L10 [Deltaproteobacteria bacterium]
MKKEEKNAIIVQLAESLNRASIAVVSEYKGIKAGESDDLRRRLRAAQGEFRVAKNTLVRLAIKNTRFEALEPNLGGTVGLLLSYADPVELAKTINSLRELGERFKVRGGVLEGKPLTAGEISALATLPPREVIFSQLLGLLQAPAARLARLLNEPGSALARLLDAATKKRGEAAPDNGDSAAQAG